jgi:hypothetical protein
MRLASVGLLGLTVLSVACSGVRVRTDYEPEADFTALRTFAWIDPPVREEPRSEPALATDPFTHNSLIDKRVRDEVEALLSSRDYQKAADGETPDFLLRYELVNREVTRDSPVFISGGYARRGYASDVGYYRSTTYEEGTLILDVIDPGTQRIAWRGWGTSAARDGQMEPERLSKVIHAILERFPPQAPTQPAAPED